MIAQIYALANDMFEQRGMAVDVFFSQDLELFLKTRAGVGGRRVFIDEL